MFLREKLHEGVFFSNIGGDKFKSCLILVNFITPLTEKNVCKNAVLPYMLRSGFKGCPDIIEFNKRLVDLYDASIFVDSQRAGDNQVISIGMEFISDEFVFGEKVAEQATKLLISSIFDPVMDKNNLFDKPLFKKQQDVLRNIVLSKLNNKRAYVLNKCEEIAFEGTNCAIPPHGTLEGIEELSAEGVSENYFEFLEHASVEILYVGKQTNAEITKESFKIAFGNFKNKDRFEIALKTFNFRRQLKEKTQEMEVAQAKLAILFVNSALGSTRDERSKLATQLMVTIYGGSPISKLFMNVREKMSLCYSCSAGIDKIVGSLCADAGIEENNITRAKEAILSELDAMKEGRFSDQDLINAKQILRDNLKSISDSPKNLGTWYLDKALDMTHTSPEQQIELLDQISKEDLIRQAKNFELTTIYTLK
ncbi:MAG: insulinase family protein [Oscillospiraceae bacterium]|jgi:predicted Zn-dependent peptidase|nr:insulinase family protein [Oscillospiraceae bacterium]